MKIALPKLPTGFKPRLVGAVLLMVGTTAAIVHLPWLVASNHSLDGIVNQASAEIAAEASYRVEDIFQTVQSAQTLISLSVQRGLLDLNDPIQREKFFLHILVTNPQFTWVQFGYPNGDYLGAQRVITDQQQEILKIHFRQWNPQTKTSIKTVRSYQVKGETLTLISQDSFLEEIPYYSPKRPWYQASIAQPKQQVWTVYLYRTSNTPGLDSTITLRQNNQILGVIGIGFELKKISLQLQKQFQNREGDIFIVNSKGELIASNHPDEPIPAQVKGQDRAQLKQLNEATDPEIKRAVHALEKRNISFQQMQQGQRFLDKDPNTGEQYYISLLPSNHLDWVVGTVIPQSIYFDAIRRNEIRLFLIVSGFVLSIAIASIIVIDRMIAQPIEKIVEAIADVESGKIEEINLQEISQQSNELGHLAQAFQMMAYQVYAREQALKKAEVELQVLNQDLEARIQKRTGELESSLAEKNTLLQEVHHRVKNNLQMIASMLKLQAASVQDPKILDTLKISQSRVRVMALIHEKLYQSSDLSRINFASYIEQLLKDLTVFYSTAERKPNLQLQVDSLELGVELAIPCGLIINELVSNALKHAFPGNQPGIISIVFRLTDSQEYSLSVADNGVGLPDSFDVQNSPSLGLQLVQALTRQLEGQIEFKRGHGSTIQILFPTGGKVPQEHPTSNY